MAQRELSRAGRVLAGLLESPGATRPQLCQAAGLSPAAMQGVVDRLRQGGAIQAQGFSPSSGGRRAQRYGICPQVGRVAGLSLDKEGVSAALYDGQMNRLAEVHIPFDPDGSGPEAGLAALAGAVEELIALAGPGAPLLCAGVALEGAVEAGRVAELEGAPLWKGFPLEQRLSQALGVGVSVSRGSWMALRQLRAGGQVSKPQCAALLRVGERVVEGALMAGGQVFQGGHGHPGALGHLTVRRDGIPCPCGNTGCLNLYCSQRGMTRQYAAQTGKRCASVGELFTKMDQGDQAAIRTVSQALGYLAEALCALALAWDPLEILVDCPYLARRQALLFTMIDAFYARSAYTRAEQAQVRLVQPPPLPLAAAAWALAVHLPRDPRWRD